ASRLRTLSSTCWPAPDGAKPSCSSTTKSSGSVRNLPGPSGAPWARGGSSASSFGIDEEHHRLRGDAFGPPEKAELLGSRRLYVDPLDIYLEKLRDLAPDVIAHRRELRPLRKHRHIGVSYAELAGAQHVHDRTHEAFAVGALPARIGVLEVLPDVAEPGRPEQRIGKRVQHDVAVGVRHDAMGMRHTHAAQHDEVAGAECMHVDARAYSHQRVSFRSAAAIARSAALVILRFAAAPSTSSGRSPSHSSACASSVGMRPAA